MQKKVRPDALRQKLIHLGVERVVDAVLEWADYDAALSEKVERLVSGPEEKGRRFKAKLKSLPNRKRFVDWREAPAFAMELSGLLSDIGSSMQIPEQDLKLVADFFEKDAAIFEACDDSGGHLGMVFSFDARELVARFAKGCKDPDWVADVAHRLYSKDNYGVRGSAIEAVAQALPPETGRKLAAKFQQEAERQSDESQSRHWLHGIELLAKGLKDPALFEQVQRQLDPQLHTKSCLEIARVWFDGGDAEAALRWVERAPEDGGVFLNNRDDLLRLIYEKLGCQEDLMALSWRTFRRNRCKETLKDLLKFIGKGERERVVEQETNAILSDKTFSTENAQFLLDMAKPEHAEHYTVENLDQINGDLYYSLTPLADGFKRTGRFLGAVVVYRALLDSILERARSKHYHHGVRYLKELDKLSLGIEQWSNILPHSEYVQKLRKSHSRKFGFWSAYEP